MTARVGAELAVAASVPVVFPVAVAALAHASALEPGSAAGAAAPVVAPAVDGALHQPVAWQIADVLVLAVEQSSSVRPPAALGVAAAPADGDARAQSSPYRVKAVSRAPGFRSDESRQARDG